MTARVALFIAAITVAFVGSGCVGGEFYIRSPIPNIIISTGASSYIEVRPMEGYLQWDTIWLLPYPYGNSGRERRY